MQPAIIGTIVLALLVAGCSLFERDDVLVLIRAEDPFAHTIAETWARARDIPERRILALSLGPGGDRPEIDWESYRRTIADPIEDYLEREDPKGEIEILVTTRGLPLRVGRCEGEEREQFPRHCRMAALDAALATLGRLDASHPGLAASANPYFGDRRSFAAFRRAEPEAALRFLVARLTGPPPAPAEAPRDADSPPLPDWLRRLASSDAPEASTEEPQGAPERLWQIHSWSRESNGDVAESALLDAIPARLEARGERACRDCDSTTDSGRTVGLVSLALAGSGSAPSDDRPDGRRLEHPAWVVDLTPHLVGSKDRARADWSARLEGAIAGWLDTGARAISIHLDDPSLAGVTRPALLLEAVADGRPAVEAHFRAVPHLGWTNLFVGDPLVRLAEPETSPGDDRDGDGIADDDDNCLEDPNPDQRDSNEDGLGNRCDPDVDGDGRVTTSWGVIYPMDARGDLERIALSARNGPFDPDHDLDGDGDVDEQDLALAQLWLFRAPGPSGLQDAH
jgi:hypothetical protein